MKKDIRVITLVSILSSSLLAANATSERKIESMDEGIRKELKTKIDSERYLRDDVSFTTAAGVVTLHGTVDNPYEKDRAEVLAKYTEGVRAVHNDLVVYVEESVPKETVMQRVPDWDLERKITSRIFLSTHLDSEEVKVEVRDGVAFLNGYVDSFHDKQLATHKAFDQGAQGVVNNIVVSQS